MKSSSGAHALPNEVLQASKPSISAYFARQVRLSADRIAVESPRLTLTYEELDRRSRHLQQRLNAAGVKRGDRICILSENDPDFLTLTIAALRIGAPVATLNTRLLPSEIAHCINLVGPKIIFASQRARATFGPLDAFHAEVIEIGADTALDAELSATGVSLYALPELQSDPEDIQYIIYTSGTTGLPKGAMISQRAMLARLMVYLMDYRVDRNDTFIAWSPLCHMASVELGFGTLLLGGKVVVLDGADMKTICDRLENEPVSNLIFFPGMVEQAIAYLQERRPTVRSLKKFGALADLFNPGHIAELTRLLGVPYTNTFGSTETGMAPASAGTLTAGVVPTDFGKSESAMCEVRLFREDGQESRIGEIGELSMRGPTLFSGYWAAPVPTQEAFRGGWYRSGDMFCRRTDGKLDYVDRLKYLIKSGGENIYPAEIERVIMTHSNVAEAVAVRRPDAKWGEVPVVVVVAKGTPPAEKDLVALCRAQLASFKCPKQIFFVSPNLLPRNNTGKVMRGELEKWVRAQA